MNAALAVIDWIIIGAYLLFALAVGVIFSRSAGRSTDEFFISGRNLPWWLAGPSMVATSFASDTPLIVTRWVREGGLSENWLWWSFAIGGMLSVFLLARLWRRACVVTDVELTELRYSGRPAAVLRGFRAGYLALPINCMTMAWVTVAMIKLLKVIFEIPPVWAVTVCILLATFYSVLSIFRLHEKEATETNDDHTFQVQFYRPACNGKHCATSATCCHEISLRFLPLFLHQWDRVSWTQLHV